MNGECTRVYIAHWVCAVGAIVSRVGGVGWCRRQRAGQAAAVNTNSCVLVVRVRAKTRGWKALSEGESDWRASRGTVVCMHTKAQKCGGERQKARARAVAARRRVPPCLCRSGQRERENAIKRAHRHLSLSPHLIIILLNHASIVGLKWRWNAASARLCASSGFFAW